ncbi:Electron transfer flavoprotein subunit alpha [Candidatus Kinetoplastibacterium sorsogonicusi]|uniref:Electron transfer flavoprotein subunit alpha n=1 Tax=Candidatus Kinetoplastidibacterium kentomonadis TaxID=1576550 RepID=A0A3S7JA21_9PROT|nr:electron transfer flavoprotein subunit alpha/FixB family protein [Candidatus Kinetoplastibacterium sorsogonicusi]AWD32522.1 Electron transfer flavoprotein subunit alpha [Candidatus Kinetoplastibacterium sorsogonicusi]
MTVLIIAEYNNNQLESSTISTINAAKLIENDIHLMICGSNLKNLILNIHKLDTVSKIIIIENDNYFYISAETMTKEILNIYKKYEYILFASTSFGKDIAPRLAALLDVSPISNVIDIKSPNIFLRQIYSGKFLIEVEINEPIKILTICTSSFSSHINYDNDNIFLEYLNHKFEPYPYKNLINKSIVSNEKNFSNSNIIVSGGYGIGSAENFNNLIQKLAKKLNGAAGASKAAVDAGYADNNLQIGQTGKTVSPDIYIAIGISGAIQHIVGMKQSKIIIAINQDPEANIFKIADYGMIGDLFEIIPLIIEKI